MNWTGTIQLRRGVRAVSCVRCSVVSRLWARRESFIRFPSLLLWGHILLMWWFNLLSSVSALLLINYLRAGHCSPTLEVPCEGTILHGCETQWIRSVSHNKYMFGNHPLNVSPTSDSGTWSIVPNISCLIFTVGYVSPPSYEVHQLCACLG